MTNEDWLAWTLAVPKNNPWKPAMAETLAAQLIHILDQAREMGLYIAASPQRIRWGMMFPQSVEASIKAMLYGLFPGVQVVEETDLVLGDKWWYEFKAAGEFTLPWVGVEDFKAVDPLAVLVNALSTVRTNEQVLYLVSLSAPSKDYRRELDRVFIPSVWQSILHGVKFQLLKPLPPSAESVQGERAYKEMAYARMTQPLAEATLHLNLQVADQQRANEFIPLVYNTLKQFDAGFNAIAGGEQGQTMVLTPAELGAFWHLPTEHCATPGIIWAKPSPKGLFEPPSAQEGDYVVLGRSGYLGQLQPVYLAYKDRKNHVNIVGRSEMGKSTLIHNLVYQDMLKGKTIGVIDPKGDLITEILATIPPSRVQDVILFDVADKANPIGLNLLALPSGVSPDEVAGRVLDLIKKYFADDWPGEQTEGAFYAVILTLLYAPGSTLMDISRLFNDEPYRTRVVSKVDDVAALEFWDEYQRRSPGERSKIAAPVVTRARRFYRDRTLQRIICQAKGLNFRWLIDTNKIFLASLAGLGGIEAHTLGALLITKFQLAVMSRTDIPESQRQPLYLYVDEVQNFTTHSLSVLFSQGRSFGLSLATANQFFSQLAGETLEAVLGTVGTNICFAAGKPSAEQLAGLMRPEFVADDLQQLDKYAAAVKMQKQGQTLPAFLLQTLPPPTVSNDPAKIDRIRQHSRQTYGRPASEVDAELRRRYDPSEPEQPNAAPLPTDPTQPPAPNPTDAPLRGDIDLDEVFE